jgi:hypothetical protein
LADTRLNSSAIFIGPRHRSRALPVAGKCARHFRTFRRRALLPHLGAEHAPPAAR